MDLNEMFNSQQNQNYFVNQMSEQIKKNLILNRPIQQPKNLMIEEQKKLNSLVEDLKSKLTSIQYENIKLNAQIDVLNKTVDFNNE